jgi:hypothetical protein
LSVIVPEFVFESQKLLITILVGKKLLFELELLFLAGLA